MKRLQAYEFSVISSLMVVLQLATPTFLFSFIVGAWALWILRKPEVRAAFKEQLDVSSRTPLGPPDGTPQAPTGPDARARVKWPSHALLMVGILYATLTVLGGLIGWAGVLYTNPAVFSTHGDAARWWTVATLFLLAQGPIMIMGALKMRHLESYGWALAGSIVALVPATPLAVFGLPTGVWALAVLTAPEVKAAFPAGGEQPSAV